MPRMPRSGFLRIASVERCVIEFHAGRRVGMTWNVSVRGAYVVVDPVPDIGERVRLSFQLPNDSEPVRVEARVAWQNIASAAKGVGLRASDLPPGCGLEFLTLDAADRRRLEARVDEVASVDGR